MPSFEHIQATFELIAVASRQVDEGANIAGIHVFDYSLHIETGNEVIVGINSRIFGLKNLGYRYPRLRLRPVLENGERFFGSITVIHRAPAPRNFSD